MSEIIVASFPDRDKAFAARRAFAKLGQNYTIEPEDIEVVSRSRSNAIRIHPEVNTQMAHVFGGAIWGAVLGTVFLMPILGAAVGSAVGFFTGRAADIGINRDYMRAIGRDIAPGHAAVALLARKVDPSAVAETVSRFGGKVLRSSLSGKTEDQIRTYSETDTPEKADRRDQPHIA